MDNISSDKKPLSLKSGNIVKLIFNYSSVIFISLIFNELYNIVDTIFVSRGVGDNAMGGVSIIFPFMLIQGAVSQTIGSGAASLVSKKLGENKNEQAGNITINAMFLFYAVSIAITVLGLIFIEPLLTLFGATPDIFEYSKEYFTIILIGNVFSTGFSSIIRAEGKMVYSLLIWLIPTAINVSLDAIFIYGLDFGVKGAALATVISYFTSFIMSVYFFKKISVQSFKTFSIKIKTIYEIVTLGIPMLIQLGGMSVIFMIINKSFSLSGGTLYVNTFAYISKIITFALVPFTAVAAAVSPIIGFNFGAKNFLRVKKAFNTSVVICEIYAVFAIATALILPRVLMFIFTSDETIINTGREIMLKLSASMLFVPVFLITGSYFQAIGKKLPAFVVSIVVLLTALIFSTVLGTHFSADGICFSIVISCIISAFVSVILKRYIKITKTAESL